MGSKSRCNMQNAGTNTDQQTNVSRRTVSRHSSARPVSDTSANESRDVVDFTVRAETWARKISSPSGANSGEKAAADSSPRRTSSPAASNRNSISERQTGTSGYQHKPTGHIIIFPVLTRLFSTPMARGLQVEIEFSGNSQAIVISFHLVHSILDAAPCMGMSFISHSRLSAQLYND